MRVRLIFVKVGAGYRLGTVNRLVHGQGAVDVTIAHANRGKSAEQWCPSISRSVMICLKMRKVSPISS
ncbi:MAG: hypothetical protein CV089_20350 [Nitrospira sp. WS110]|nr:hypothetical protein [Nitrospira sp. WS110]